MFYNCIFNDNFAWEDVDVDGRIILEWTLRKYIGKF